MPDEQKKRPWYAVKRLQGFAVLVAGIGMLFCPATAPHAGTVIAAGAGWMGVGQAAKMVRQNKDTP